MLPFVQAAEALKQAIRISPGTAEVHFALGSAYCALSRWAQAIEAYKQATRLRPDLSGAHFGLGLCYLIVGEKDSALKEYRILKDLDKDFATPYVALSTNRVGHHEVVGMRPSEHSHRQSSTLLYKSILGFDFQTT